MDTHLLTWNNNFSSHTGFLECRITRVRNTFFPKEMTTKGSMSQPVRVTAASNASGGWRGAGGASVEGERGESR